jgi:hypothetical protein
MNFQNTFRWCIIGAAIQVIFSILIFLVQKSWYVSPYMFWASGVLQLMTMVYAFQRMQFETNDAIPQQELLKAGVLIWGFSGVGYFVTYYILLNFVDPSLSDLQKADALASLEKFGKGMNPKDLAKKLDEVRSYDFRIGIQDTFLAIARGFLSGFLFSFIGSYLMTYKNRTL